MGFWNYRIVHTKEPVLRDGKDTGEQYDYWAVYEVFYNSKGEPHSRTKDPVTFGSDFDEDDVRRSVMHAIGDALLKPVLEETDITGKADYDDVPRERIPFEPDYLEKRSGAPSKGDIAIQIFNVGPSFNFDGPRRVETGVVQFNDDWPGIFIRGDVAFGYAAVLSAHLRDLEGEGNGSQISRMLLSAMAKLFLSCDLGRSEAEV